MIGAADNTAAIDEGYFDLYPTARRVGRVADRMLHDINGL